MSITIIIPYRDNVEGLKSCLGSIAENIPVIVVDDLSANAPDISVRPSTRVIHLDKRGYFSGAVNTGIKACKTDVLILNQDLVVKGDYLKGLAKLGKVYAMVGDGVMKHPLWPKGYVQGTFMYLRRDAIEAVGLLDEVNWPLWGATCEWQLRACRKGFLAYPLMKPEWYEHAREGNFGSAIQATLQEEPDKKELYIRTPPLINVVAPCFKHGKYAGELWDSLKAQTFQGFDLTIVDDCSPDDSWQKLIKLTPDMEKKNENLYQDDWTGVKVVRQAKNGGTPVAVNAGIKLGRAKYIMVMDGDDMLAPNALERYLQTIQENPGKLIYSNCMLWANGAGFQKWRFKPYDFDELCEKNFISAGVMFERSSYNDVGGYPEAFRWGRQDWAFAVRMGLKGHCGVWLDEYLYRYRREGQNRVLTNSTQEWAEFFMDQMRQQFPEAYSGRRPMGCCGGRGSARLASLASRAAVGNTRLNATLANVPGTMVMVEYIGKNEGRTTYFGEVTGTRYVVGGGRRHIYVDKQDAAGILAILVGKQKIFKLYVEPKPVAKPVPVTVEEEVQ